MRGMRVSIGSVLLGMALAGVAGAQNAADVEAVVATDAGSFRIEFYGDQAPRHVQQFLADAGSGFYDGTSFFRVWANGLIQGGDPLTKDSAAPRARWGTGGFNRVGAESNGLQHERGAVAALNIQGKTNSDGSQFVVCVSSQPALDGKYTVFAHVSEGMDVVERISRLPVDANGLTQQPVRIQKITVEPKKQEPFANATSEELHKIVTLHTTLGDLRIETEPGWAPHTVQRFLMLCATGWYDHTIFHRLVKGFVLQGGANRTDNKESAAGESIHPADRWVHPLVLEAAADIKQERGIVSMAHADDPNSGTTSFFVVLGPAPHLDGKFAAFGKVVDGWPVLDAFEKEDVEGETPKRRLEIESAKIEPYMATVSGVK